MAPEVEDEFPDQLEYRVKWDIGTNGASTAFYIQRPTGVKKQLLKLRQQRRTGIVVQARPVGEWFEAYDEQDLADLFHVPVLPPDWQRNYPTRDDKVAFAHGHASRYPALAHEGMAYDAFVRRVVEAMDAGQHVPDFDPRTS